MSQRSFSLLLSFALLGICHSELPCSFNDLVQNLDFPNKSIRPVKNWLTVTNVSIDLILNTVVDLNTALMSLTTMVWFSMSWDNEFITWDPDKNCSIKSICITGVSLWIPDIYIYEMTQNEKGSSVISYFNISHQGKINIVKPLRIVSACELNIYKFPFDKQKCSLTFGSYIHSAKDMFITSSSDSHQLYSNTNKVFTRKGDWILLNITVNTSLEDIGGINYSKIYYEITLKRQPVVHLITLILPACFMVFLDIFSMFLHMESRERLGFKITIVLGFSVLLLILNSKMPSSEIAPVLGIFWLACMAVMVFSIIGCVTISYMLMLSESQCKVPSWVKTWILTYLATFLCFKSFRKYGINMDDPESVSETYSNNRIIKTNAERRNETQISTEECNKVQLLKKLLIEILKIHTKLMESRIKQEFKSEWKAAALVLDRFVLIVYLIIVTVVFAYVCSIWVS